MRSIIKKIVVIAAILAGISFLVYHKVSSKPEKSSKNVGGSSGQLAVDVVVAGGTRLDNAIQAVGTVLANEEVVLQPEAQGRVTGIFFNEGTMVNKGALLMKLDDSELKAELSKVVHNKKLAEEQESRQQRLFEKGGISRSEYDMALNALNVLKSEEALLKVRITKTELRAPFSGMIGLRSISSGAYVTTSTLVTSLQDISTLKLEFSIPGKYASQIRPGQEVTFHIQGLDTRFKATIYAIDPRVDQETRTIMVKARFKRNGLQVFPGAFAQIYLVLNTVEDAVMVPSEAIVPDVNGQRVYKYVQGKVAVSPVTVGLRKENAVQVLQGISFGDTLITSGILQLRPGAEVNIKKIIEPFAE